MIKINLFFNQNMFRNTNFKNFVFNRLKFNLKKEPIKNEKEGYVIQKGTLSIPLMGDDPYNVYSSMPTGEYFTIKDIDILIYNKKLHKKFRKYHKNGNITTVDVFETWWGYYEIYRVVFVNSVIKNTNFHKRINFNKSSFHDTSIENCIFDKITFDTCLFEYTTIVDCQFISCQFKHTNLINTVFLQCKFNESTFNNCKISGRMIECDIIIDFKYCEMYKNLFEKCNHIKCDNWDCYYPYYEEYSIGKSWVHYIKDEEFNKMLTRE